MNPETTTLAQWVVAVVAAGGVTALGFLVRNAFHDTTSAVKELGAKLDVMTAAQAKSDGDRRVLETRLAAVERTVERLERELSEGIAR